MATRSITIRSSSSSGCRPSSSSGGPPRWRSTRESTTRSAGWPSTSRTPIPGARSTRIDPAARPVAYFSAEFGLHESLPIYSGGLGVLAGDHLKSASDLGIPLIGVGLLYAQGYFRQTLDSNGWQQELYLNADLELLADRERHRAGRTAALGRDRDDDRRAARAGLAGRGRPDHAAAPRLERAAELASRIGR